MQMFKQNKDKNKYDIVIKTWGAQNRIPKTTYHLHRTLFAEYMQMTFFPEASDEWWEGFSSVQDFWICSERKESLHHESQTAL